jgi:hypothetical protein
MGPSFCVAYARGLQSTVYNTAMAARRNRIRIKRGCAARRRQIIQ